MNRYLIEHEAEVLSGGPLVINLGNSNVAVQIYIWVENVGRQFNDWRLEGIHIGKGHCAAEDASFEGTPTWTRDYYRIKSGVSLSWNKFEAGG